MVTGIAGANNESSPVIAILGDIHTKHYGRGPATFHEIDQENMFRPITKMSKRIESVDRILVAANNIFHYCRRKDGEPLSSILEALADRYSYAHLPDAMDLSGVPRADILTSILNSLLANNVGDALDHILELNRVVMDQRGGAPWVEIEGGDTLRVRVQSETAELRDQTYLEAGWDYDYFLGSFIRIANDGLGAGWKLR